MADELINIQNLKKKFGDHAVLDGISFHVDKGENLVVFGKSGTGKSVLLKCMVGLLVPEAGEIFIEGQDVLKYTLKQMNSFRKQLSFLFQGAALYDSMSVRENLEFPLVRNFSFTKDEMTKKVERALDMVSLSEAIDKMPAELSGGMRKRIGLARSIITEPMLMLYDEPTTGLDPITSKEISTLIRDLQAELKMTSIAVTHDLLCAQIIADRSIVLNEGKIIFEGKMDELLKSDDRFLRNFFSPEVFEDD
jgi:phospholipid/cholesterol/gamma-HCH transport system ATP-binding protein